MRCAIALIVLVSSLSSQGMTQEPQYVSISRDKVLVAIASQPDCPLRIQAADFLFRVDQPGVLIKYTVKNVSNKPIRFFQVVGLEHSGSGGTLPNPLFSSKRVLMPNEIVESAKERSDYRLIPMTPAIREKLKPENQMQALYILFVEKVFFADGSTYEDEGALKALSAFLADAPDK